MQRYGKTTAQQCKYYEVDNIFDYMVETYLNGNISTFQKLYKKLRLEAKREFIRYAFDKVNPRYQKKIIEATTR